MTIIQFSKKVQSDIKELHRLLSSLPSSLEEVKDLKNLLSIARIDFNLFRHKLEMFIEKNKDAK